MKYKINNAPEWAIMVSVFCLLLANLGLKGQDKYLNSYNNETEINASRSVTLGNGFYIPAGKNVRIFTGASFKRCMPFVGVPSTSQNYVSSQVFKIPGINNFNINDSMSVCSVNQTIQYFDGLGRTLQTVTTQGSPDFRDIVQPVAYDAFGREAIKYLPYPESTGGNGSYRNTAISAQQAFFNNPLSGVTAIPNTAFSETRFEASPLSRVLEQGAPGVSWQLSSDHTQKIEYRANDAGEVKLWRVVPGGANGTNTYAAGRLYKTISKDENWKPADGKAGIIEEYKDLEGRVVLKRVWETDSKRLSTYYVYDDFGNLRYVLPPAVNENSEYVSSPIDNFSESDQIFKQFMYAYHYDGRRRITRKKLPGKGWDYMVYNKLDQVVLSQDSIQRSTHQWLFNKYDAFGRMVSSGVYSKNSSLEGLQAIVNSQTQLWEIRLGTEYDGASFPQQDIETQLVNYYDDYNVSGIPDNRSASYSAKLKGLTTASKVKVLGTNDFLWTVSYYDDEARVVQIYKQHYLGGQVNASNYDDITNKYSFVGELTESVRMHHAGSNVTKIANRYEYDHVGRKLASFEAINDGTEVALNKSDYNEIGQLMKKYLHSTDGTSFVQSNTYQYNERGWLSKINDPDQLNSANVFGMELLYGNKEDAFNGNIGGMRWQALVPPGQGLTGSLQSFAYDYDKLNRLKNARYTTPGAMDQFNEELQYDIMGNIAHLKRKNNVSGYLNDFTYDYLSQGIGNKLWKVSDIGTAGQTSNYTYDANGNLKTDSFKGININYNMLNLPGTITKSGESLSYVYDASGQKLRKVYNGMARDYVSGIEYNNGVLEFIQTEEGRALPGAVYSYEYLLKDHLGNTRVAINQTGEIIQVQDYYAFGMEMGNSKSPSPKNQYKYNGKEMQEELGLNQLDYGARFYDPVIGRWNVVDPKAQLLEISSPYVYSLNSPTSFIDKDGELPIYIGGKTNDDSERNSKDYWDAQILATVAGSGIPNPGYTALVVDGNKYLYQFGDKKELRRAGLTEGGAEEGRTRAGYEVGKADFKRILSQLERDPKTGKITEKIQIYTHSRGAAFGVGYTEALLEMIKQNSDQFADAVNEIDFVYNMAPHGAGNITAPNGVDSYSHHHDRDKLSSNGMKGVVAAFSSAEKLPKGLFAAHANGSFVKDIGVFLKSWQSSKGDSKQLINDFVKKMGALGIKVTVN